MTADHVPLPPEPPRQADRLPDTAENASNPGPTDDTAQDDGQRNDRETGTNLIASLLRQAGENAASERALTNATFALQINNLTGGSGTALRSESVSADTLHRLRRTFVAPDHLASAWDVLAKQHLLLLRASADDGREHLATFLLDAFCDARVRRLENESLDAVTASDLTAGGGHLWPGPTGDRFDQRVAETLAGRLRKLEAYMIVIWPGAVECPAELGDYLAEPGRPDPRAVLRKHLNDAAEPLIVDERVAAALSRLSGARHAVQVARLLDQVAFGQKPLETALAEANRPTHGIPNWFANLPEREDRAFALALSALDDLSLPTVVAGARLLDELIQRMEDPEDRCGLLAFHRPTSALLAAVEAECVSDIRETRYGRAPVTAVRLRRRGFARKMLDDFWLSFPYLQEVYLEWMKALAKNQDGYVRERAAFAAGLLAAHDFDFIRHRLLLGWAADADPRLRRAAATALRPPASSGHLRETVWTLLDQWAESDGYGRGSRFHQRLTAATALGGPVGAGDPERALDVITRRLLPHVTNEDDFELWRATALAVAELFGDGSVPASDAVLRRAANWAETKETGPSTVAVAVLFGLAGKPADQNTEEGPTMPPLLRATGRSPGNVEFAALLWRMAIAHPKFAADALRGLRILAQHVGVDNNGGNELTGLVRAIPHTTRDRRTLQFEIRRWAQDKDNPSPPISVRLQEALAGGDDR